MEGLRDFFHYTAWGTVGEWVSGLGALGAVLVSVYLWRAERTEKLRAQDAHRAQENEDRETRRTQQAHQVFVWKVWEDYGEEQYGDGVSMHNGSDLPVFDVSVVGHAHPGGPSTIDGPDGNKDVVLPSQGFAAPGYGKLLDNVMVVFRDANGATWMRDSKGRLEENPDPQILFFGTST